MTRHRILLVDDHALVLLALRVLLESDPSLEVVDAVQNGIQAVKIAARTKPHLAIIDVRMPVLSGPETTKELLRHSPRTRVVGLSAYTDCGTVSGMLKAGAKGYVCKGCETGELCRPYTPSERAGTICADACETETALATTAASMLSRT